MDHVSMDYINIRGYLKILNFNIRELKTMFWDSKKEHFDNKVVDRIESYTFNIKFVSIQLHMKKLLRQTCMLIDF
jgi:hypothetical protein